MKKVILAAALVSFFLAAFSVQVYAAEKKDEKTHITIGIKTWINSYEQWERSGSTEYTAESNTVIMAGPVLGITWDKYFAGVSYLKTLNDYEADLMRTNTLYAKLKDERQEVDLSLGYYVHQRVGVFLGYKNVWWHAEQDAVVNKIRLFGPLVGLTVNYPIGQTGLTPFATAAHYWLRQTDSNPREEKNMTGPSIEAGLAYTYRSITLTAGYKWHGYYSENFELKFGGPIVSINYGF